MACYHPSVGYRKPGETGQMTFAHIPRDYVENAEAYLFSLRERGFDVSLIPCGKCVGCRLDYSREWANRCMLEASQYEFNWFVTLTYDPEHLPSGGTLVKKELSDFIKRLRRHWEYAYGFQGIRFYACGEYGSKYMRPHYHVIFFNLPVDDLVFVKCENGHITWTSETVSQLWSRGIVTFNECNWHTCAYVARYMLKKQKGEDRSLYEELGLLPEFTVSSRRPGIGYNYFEQNKDKIYATDSIYVPKGKGVLTSKPPKYFDRKLKEGDADAYLAVQQSRTSAFDALYFSKLKGKTDLRRQQYRNLEEEVKEDTIKALARFYEM